MPFGVKNSEFCSEFHGTDGAFARNFLETRFTTWGFVKTCLRAGRIDAAKLGILATKPVFFLQVPYRKETARSSKASCGPFVVLEPR